MKPEIKVIRKGRVVYWYEFLNGKWLLAKVICSVLLALVLFSSCAMASTINAKDAVKTIIGEEEQDYTGMCLVASTIRNRHTLKGAYGLRSHRVTAHLYSAKSEQLAKQAWKWSETHNLHCCNWFSDNDLKMVKVQNIIRKGHLILVKRVGKGRYHNNFYRKA